ncbi:YcgL domain-containing protein [Alcanivorax quisquiliarum]|uniref:YcgL domain-containing protein MU846_13520 n=1 Tax=Alcanivorax quisquiliarum TaxID=2933565 RepID=A0ABT0EAF9_9GAMM|nr:YcgL domain-containing protein [Alcanivorax quisquiliarum]MCK0538728.1 YcgL domain-containing protein [Alcanivorax quisquiliarum]
MTDNQTTSRHLICSIYHSSKREGMYLFVDKPRGLACVPEPLMQQFGTPRHVSDMLLRPGRPLARADVEKVRGALLEQGWYLQMPPPPDSDLYLAQGHPGRDA